MTERTCPRCGSSDLVNLQSHLFCNNCPTRICDQPSVCEGDPTCTVEQESRLPGALCRKVTEFNIVPDTRLRFPYNLIFSTRRTSYVPKNIGYIVPDDGMVFVDFVRKPYIEFDEVGLVERV